MPPDCAGAKALQDLSEMILKVGLLAVEPKGNTVRLQATCYAGDLSLFRIGRQELCLQESYRLAVQMGTAPGVKLGGPRPRLCLISDQRVGLAPCGPKHQGLACQDAHPHIRREGMR